MNEIVISIGSFKENEHYKVSLVIYSWCSFHVVCMKSVKNIADDSFEKWEKNIRNNAKFLRQKY